MKQLNYCNSARQRIREVSEKEISVFLKEINPKNVTKVIEILPIPRGFRSTSKNGRKKVLSGLSQRLVGAARENAVEEERDFDALSMACQLWGYEHLRNTSTISEFFDIQKYEHVEADDDLEEEVAASCQSLLQHLSDADEENKCSRQHIERFLIFSPVGNVEDFEEEVNKFPDEQQIKRFQAIDTLPGQITHIEATLEQLNTKIRDQEKEIQDNKKSIAVYEAQINEVNLSLQDLAAKSIRHDKSIELQESANDKLLATLNFVKENHEGIFKELSDSVEGLQSSSEEIIESGKSLNTQFEETNSINEATFEEIRNTIDGYSEALEKLPNLADNLPSQYDSNVSFNIKNLVGGGTSEKIKKIDRFKDAFDILATSLRASGLRKSASEILANEMLAAIGTQQCVLLRGELALQLARACAFSLAGTSVYEISVPIGLTGPGIIEYAFSMVEKDHEDGAKCIIIEGLNRSAFDAFGNDLVQRIAKRRLGERVKDDSIFVLATLSDGPSSLPLTKSYSSLGPIFFTDLLDWQIRPVKSREYKYGKLYSSSWQEFRTEVASEAVDSDELSRLMKVCAASDSPLIRSTLNEANKALSYLVDGETKLTTLQSLHFGWLIPMCFTAEPNLSEVSEELNEGKVDGDVVDPRLVRLLGMLSN